MIEHVAVQNNIATIYYDKLKHTDWSLGNVLDEIRGCEKINITLLSTARHDIIRFLAFLEKENYNIGEVERV